jgi:hypothetical protein
MAPRSGSRPISRTLQACDRERSWTLAVSWKRGAGTKVELLPRMENLYEQKRGLLVLSADSAGGFAAPGVLLNHVPLTRIYGDGKVVFVDRARGSGVLHEGTLSADQINGLFRLLMEKGFWELAEAYAVHGPTDLATSVITAKALGRPEKRVSSYGGAVSAPPGFMECFETLIHPQLQPGDVKTYVRQPITQAELEAGWYYGLEYEKRLNTPRSWVWIDAGRSSRWRQPEALPTPDIHFDSGYMIPALDGSHHIRIRYRGYGAGAESTILLDRNAMSPTEYGDIGVTTLMYFAPQPVTLTLLKHDDKRHLFALECAGYHGPQLRLVILGDLSHPSGGRLLVMNAEGGITNMYWLQVT